MLEGDYMIVALYANNVNIVYTNGDIDSPEDYFVDIDGTPPHTFTHTMTILL